MAVKPYRYAVLEAVAKEMRKNKNLCYFYEYESPVASLPDGTILNLWNEFGPDRTSAQGWPLDEAWYVGMGVGMAASGCNVVLELPTMTTVFAFENIFNQVGNFRMMTGGQTHLPMVIWQDGAARGAGSAQQHTQVGWETLYAFIPGLQVVVPSDAYQAVGLMMSAMHSPDPTMFCDYSEVASQTQPDIPDNIADIPYGKLNLVQEGKDLTIAAWAPALIDVKKAMADIAKAGINAEIIDIRSLKPLDEAGLAASVKKTGRLLCVDHGYWTSGFSATVLAVAAQKVPGAKVGRITFPDAAGPAPSEMIGWMRPDAPKILLAAQAMMKV